MAHTVIGIYKADIYCIDCTKRIAAGIEAAGLSFAYTEVLGETTYDHYDCFGPKKG